MPPHPHLVEFNGDITLFKQVRLFCWVRGSNGGMWQETIDHRQGEIDLPLVLIKSGGKLYRYDSPKPLDLKLSQVQLAIILQQRLRTSLRYQLMHSIATLAANLAARNTLKS